MRTALFLVFSLGLSTTLAHGKEHETLDAMPRPIVSTPDIYRLICSEAGTLKGKSLDDNWQPITLSTEQGNLQMGVQREMAHLYGQGWEKEWKSHPQSASISKLIQNQFPEWNRSEGKLTLMKFSATWCGPCQILAREFGPRKQALLDAAGGSLDIQEIDTDQNPQLSNQYSVRSLPTVLLLGADGKEIWRLDSLPTVDEIANRTLAAARALPRAPTSTLTFEPKTLPPCPEPEMKPEVATETPQSPPPVLKVKVQLKSLAIVKNPKLQPPELKKTFFESMCLDGGELSAQTNDGKWVTVYLDSKSNSIQPPPGVTATWKDAETLQEELVDFYRRKGPSFKTPESQQRAAAYVKHMETNGEILAGHKMRATDEAPPELQECQEIAGYAKSAAPVTPAATVRPTLPPVQSKAANTNPGWQFAVLSTDSQGIPNHAHCQANLISQEAGLCVAATAAHCFEKAVNQHQPKESDGVYAFQAQLKIPGFGGAVNTAVRLNAKQFADTSDSAGNDTALFSWFCPAGGGKLPLVNLGTAKESTEFQGGFSGKITRSPGLHPATFARKSDSGTTWVNQNDAGKAEKGDSGGGLFTKKEDGSLLLVGTLSGHAKDNQKLCAYSTGEALDFYHKNLEALIQANTGSKRSKPVFASTAR